MIEKIKPFRFWCHKILPLVYDESLSYYELLCKVVSYLNDLVQQNSEVIDAFTQLQEYVNTYLSDDHLAELINERLDAMAEDGTLTSLLGTLINYKSLMLNKLGRILHGHVDSEALPPNGQSVFYKDNRFYVVGNNAGGRLLTTYSQTGVMLNQTVYADIPHVNDVTGNDDSLIIATSWNAILYYVDYTTGELTDTLALEGYNVIIGCSYDPETDSLWAYGLKTNEPFLTFCEIEDGEIKKEITIPYTNGTVVQGMLNYKDDLFYVQNKPNLIYRINKSSGNITMGYRIPEGDGLYPVGEAESLFLMGDTICLTGCLYFEHLYSVSENTQISIPIFETDITKVIKPYQEWDYIPDMRAFTVTLNQALYTFNPQLTVSSALEASMMANYHQSAVINIVNISKNEGAVFQFIGTDVAIKSNYSISLYAVEAINSSVNITSCNVDYLWIEDSRFYGSLLSSSVLGCTLLRSVVTLNHASFMNCDAFTIKQTYLTLEGFLGIKNACLLTTDNAPLNIEITAKYVSNVLYFMSACNRGVCEIVDTTGMCVSFLMMAAPNGETRYPIPGQSTYAAILYNDQNDGTFYTETDGGVKEAFDALNRATFRFTGWHE